MLDLFGKTATSLLLNYQPQRNRLWANVRPIMGWPRKHLFNAGKKYPQPHKYNWRPYLPEDGTYTVRPLPIYKMGGRDLESGKVVVRTLGGGNPKKFRWLDPMKEANPDGTPRQEQVLQIKYDPLRSPKLALVADSERKRWITATHGLQVGDVITTFGDIPKNPVRAKPGDSHPIGALAVGTKVNQVESVPRQGPRVCLVAGSSAEITKRGSDAVTIKLPRGDSLNIDPKCMATVGLVSNIDNGYVKLWCPQRLRWIGKRPGSGQWRRKDGYCGRKNRPKRLIDVTLRMIAEKEAREKRFDVFDLEG